MLKQIEAILREIFNDPVLEVTESTCPLTVRGWDSLGQISLILRVEEEFNLEFGMTELVGVRTVGDLLRILETKLLVEPADCGMTTDTALLTHPSAGQNSNDLDVLETWFGVAPPSGTIAA